MMESNEGVLRAWKPVAPPPCGYFQVLRRSFESGLHVLILVSQVGKGYVVVSSVDHGTLRSSQTKEGTAGSVSEVVELLGETCARWNVLVVSSDSVERHGPRQYFYADEKGGLSGPVMRDELFSLISSGALTWDAQVWENARGLTSRGEWQPILLALGFPPECLDA